jgi:hypothetical protein
MEASGHGVLEYTLGGVKYTIPMKEMEKISRLAGQFLEVLILVKLKRHFSEVLILGELRAGELRWIWMCSACIQNCSTNYTCMST